MANPIHSAIPGAAPERQKWSHFGPDLRHYQPKTGQKRLKKGQNRPVPVTYQLTIHLCIVIILNVLHVVWQEKCGKKQVGGWGSSRFWRVFWSKSALKKVISRSVAARKSLARTKSGGREAASTAGQEAGVTSGLRTLCAHGA